MGEKPIIFSGELVPAILDDRKTQTRRVIKPQPLFPTLSEDELEAGMVIFDGPNLVRLHSPKKNSGPASRGWLYKKGFPSPYQVGDMLWVQECFLVSECDPGKTVSVHYRFDQWRHGIVIPETHLDKPTSKPTGKWHSGRFMPRWASRISLEVTEIRVEKLQDITEEDAISEGVGAVPMIDIPRQATWSNRQDFSQLWDSLNAKRGYSWETNPWVLAYTFKLLSPEHVEGEIANA